LQTLAQALRAAGHDDEAFDALARVSELEREAFRDLSELFLKRFEQATPQARAARRESDLLAAKNRQLADAHAELERRTRQPEALQEQLRDQANRDWLTGCTTAGSCLGSSTSSPPTRWAVPSASPCSTSIVQGDQRPLRTPHRRSSLKSVE